MLLVLVQQRDVLPLGGRGELAQPVDHRVAVRGGVVTLRDEEREDADEWRLEAVGDLDGALKALEVGREVIGNADLADGRADRRNADASSGQRLPGALDLLIIEIEDVGVPRTPKLEPTHVLGPERLDLLVEVRRNLVRKAGQGPHM